MNHICFYCCYVSSGIWKSAKHGIGSHVFGSFHKIIVTLNIYKDKILKKFYCLNKLMNYCTKNLEILNNNFFSLSW